MDSKFNENVFEKFYLRVSYFKSLSELVYLLTAGQGRKEGCFKIYKIQIN